MGSYRTLDAEVVKIFTDLGEIDQLARVFLASEGARLLEMQRLLAQSDLPQLAWLAHGLTGTAGSVGAYSLARLSTQLEQLARESTDAECAKKLKSLEGEFRQVESELLSLLAEIEQQGPLG